MPGPKVPPRSAARPPGDSAARDSQQGAASSATAARMPAATREWGPAAISVLGVRLTHRGWWFAGIGVVALVGAYLGGRQELLYIGCLLVALPVIAIVVVRMRRPKL